MASITYQNFFSMFPKMSGMSGTIYDAKDELYDVYGKKVVVIPTNNPIQRVDCPDWYFSDSKKQFEAAIRLALSEGSVRVSHLAVIGKEIGVRIPT